MSGEKKLGEKMPKGTTLEELQKNPEVARLAKKFARMTASQKPKGRTRRQRRGKEID